MICLEKISNYIDHCFILSGQLLTESKNYATCNPHRIIFSINAFTWPQFVYKKKKSIGGNKGRKKKGKIYKPKMGIQAHII